MGLKNTTTGDTLCDEKHPIILESMEFPEPVIRVAIEPKTKAGQEKMTMALMKLAEEDPTFKTYTDEETGQTIIAGMGELHLEIIVDRLLREFKVEANVGAPQVAYKETIKKAVEQETKYARQSGGKGQYGHVKIHVEPNESGKGYEFVNAVVGGAIPKEYIPAVDAGIQGAMHVRRCGRLPRGGREGHPVRRLLSRGGLLRNGVQDRRLHGLQGGLPQGRSHAAGAHHEGLRHRPRGVYGRRHRRPEQPPRPDPGLEARPGAQQIDALVPLAEMFGYATDLRSRTQGRGQYTMEPSHYVEIPKNIRDKIVDSAGATKPQA